MRERAGALALTVLLAGPAFAAGEIPAGVDRTAYLEVATTILCDCGCHPQSVHECACGRAAEMRDEIAAALRGKSASEVIDAYVARHGEKIRIAPTVSGFNLVAWLGPSIGLLAAGIAMALVLRRWRGAAPLPAAAAPGPAAPADDGYRQRLARELEERS